MNFTRMTRRLVLLGVILITGTPASAQKTVTIFHINDTHSYVFPWGPKVNGVPQNGAAARLVARLNERRSSAINPLLLHGGDSFTGDLAFNRFLGRAEFELFDAIGVDAMVLGNHDFDIRPFRLKEAIVASGAQFAFLSANIRYNNDTSGLSRYIKPYVVKTVGDVRVGIFGLTTTSTVFYGESTPITFDSTVATARRMVDSLRAHSVDLIVALTHLGVTEDRQIAERVSGIDIIVGGHSHTPLAEPVLVRTPAGDTTVIVQAGSKWEYLGTLQYTISDQRRSWAYQLERISAPAPDDSRIARLLEAYRDSIVETYGPVYSDTLAVLTSELPQPAWDDGQLEIPLLNLVADAYRAATRTDVAMEIGALMRQNIYSGAISTAEVRQTLSWSYDAIQGLGKRLSIIHVSGLMLKVMLNVTLTVSFDFLGGGGTFLLPLQTSGLQYTIGGIGILPTVREVWVAGNRVEDDRVYSVTLNEFLADVATRFPFIQFLSRRDTSIGPTAALEHYLRSLSRFDVSAIPMGRVWDETRTTPLTFVLENERLVVRWIPRVGVAGYNVYRKRVDESAPFTRLNAQPILPASAGGMARYEDSGFVRGSVFAYQVEELWPDGRRVLQPPVEHKVGGLPSLAYLHQNFPNPLSTKGEMGAGGRASTKVVFGIPEPTTVRIVVVNLLGQEVRELLSGERDQGEYEVVWDGRDRSGVAVPSGVYLLRLITPGYAETRKLVVVR